MRAWGVASLGPIAARPQVQGTRQKPQPKAGELLLRVNVCGICRTDLHLAEGDLPPRRANVVPGHEAVGTRFTDEQAAPLLCSGIIGYRALKRSSLPPGGRLGIYGFGASGLLPTLPPRSPCIRVPRSLS
ncbi:alcohol dehydrogenase catalytic domain-containing protein [Arthrobacter sp. CJ23]|uniref:alcohol dehydrogenase catalytic domain-containing protein n=1 Tax=Arthrobacter sp. CJ23 TaxID=2972479 RepID=UPI0037C12366